MPPLQGDPSASQLMGLPYIYAYTLCHRTTKFDVIAHMGKGLVFRGQQRPHPRGGTPNAPPIFGLPYIYVYTL